MKEIDFPYAPAKFARDYKAAKEKNNMELKRGSEDGVYILERTEYDSLTGEKKDSKITHEIGIKSLEKVIKKLEQDLTDLKYLKKDIDDL